MASGRSRKRLPFARLQRGVASGLKNSGCRNLQSNLLPLDEPRDPTQLNRYRAAQLACGGDEVATLSTVKSSMPIDDCNSLWVGLSQQGTPIRYLL